MIKEGDTLNWYLAHQKKVYGTVIKSITCRDGFEVSIQASAGHYCIPRSDEGPWSHVEIGYPSDLCEELIPYSAGDGIYARVPIEIAERLVIKHGGIKDNSTKELK